MKSSQDICRSRRRSDERGGARLNFLIALAIIATVAYVAYQYVPVAYQASLFKVYMQDTVDKAVATGKPASWVQTELKASADDYGVPPDAVFKVEQRAGRLEVNARWTRPIPLPGYIYHYTFDHTVKSSGFFKSD